MKNISLASFLKLPEEKQRAYVWVLQFVKGEPNFKRWGKTYGVAQSITELSFGEVLLLKNLILQGEISSMIEAVKVVFKTKNPLKMKIVRFYQCVNFLLNEIKKIIKTENIRYRTQPSAYDQKLQEAGAEELTQFGDLAIIDTLAGGDPLKYEQIEKLPYLQVHFLLWYRTTKENINIRLQDKEISGYRT